MPDKAKAFILKQEGNTLFSQKKFKKALEKYSAAIEADPENAVLYANRAACFASLGRPNDVVRDAKKATKLDPTYTKAWSRLGTAYQAIGAWDLSIEAWGHALSCLPIDDSSDAAKKQRTQYEESLQQAKTGKERVEKHLSVHTIRPSESLGDNGKPQQMPWVCAATLIESWERDNVKILNSSAWVILKAYGDLIEGNGLISKQQRVGRRNGMMMGWTGAIVSISNCLTHDDRAFHIADPDWISKYNNQVKVEAMSTGAWTNDGPNVVIKEAKKRLPTQGWDRVRRAVTTTVRAWIVSGSLYSGIYRNQDTAIKFYKWAVDLLEEGQKTWKDVPEEDRGVIFSDTFARGVRKLYMSAYMKACAERNPKCTLEKMYEMADKLYEDTMAATPWPKKDVADFDGTGFHLAFNVYPAAEAQSIKALYHIRMSEDLHSSDIQTASEHLSKAGPLYREAGDLYPPDDESSVYMYCCAVDAMYRSGYPVKEYLPILIKIRENSPQMQQIWQQSSLAIGGRDKVISAMLKYEEQVLKAIRDGSISEDDTFSPSFPDGDPLSLIHDDLSGTVYA